MPTSAVRGAVPVDPSTGQLNFAGLRTNLHYEPPAVPHGGAGGGSVGLSGGSSSDSLSQQVMRDSGLSDPLRRL